MSDPIGERIAAALKAVSVSAEEAEELRKKFPATEKWWVSAIANGRGGTPELLRRLAKMRGLARYRSGFLTVQDFCCVCVNDVAEAVRIAKAIGWLQSNFWKPSADVVHGWVEVGASPTEPVHEKLETDDGQGFRLAI